MNDLDRGHQNTAFKLTEQFFPTAKTSCEYRKARIKNENLSSLQLMYNGDPLKPLHCLITGHPGWLDGIDYGTGQRKSRFTLDFNHIRQECSNNRKGAGKSLDKSIGPSDLFRTNSIDPSYPWPKRECLPTQFDRIERERDVFEFATMMPICTAEHTYITQDSHKSDLTLLNFPRKTWPWCLQNHHNFNETKRFLDISYFDSVTHDWFIDHMCDITHPAIRDRLATSWNHDFTRIAAYSVIR
jgi:hypothetical protein